MQDQDSALLHAFVLDGRGGARSINRDELDSLQLGEQESLWLHWDRSQEQSQRWLREHSGLDEFSCSLLLEENTRPRLLPLPDDELLLFLRGVNRNPGAEPEDMVSVRIFADARRVISLRQRPLLATDALIADLLAGKGPKTSSELLLEVARHLTSRVDDLIAELSEQLDGEVRRMASMVMNVIVPITVWCCRCVCVQPACVGFSRRNAISTRSWCVLDSPGSSRTTVTTGTSSTIA